MSSKGRQLLVNECMKLKGSTVLEPMLKAGGDDGQQEERGREEEMMEHGVRL